MVLTSNSQWEKKFKPTLIAHLFGLLSTTVKIFGYLSYLFALVILVLPSFREVFVNWAIIALIFGFIMNKIAGSSFSKYGPITLTVTNRGYEFNPNFIYRSIFGNKAKFTHEFILHYDYHNHHYLKFLPIWITIFTTDNKFDLNFIRWNNINELNGLVEKLSTDKNNIYVRNAYYKNTIRNALFSILRTTQGKIGGFILLIYLLMTLIGGISYIFYPPNPTQVYSGILFNPDYILYVNKNYSQYGVLTPPNSDFIFGTDFIGRDIFARMIFGTFFTMSIALIAAIIITILITVIGLTSAIYGGMWDDIITRLSDVLLTFPQVVWIVLISVFSTPFRIGIPGGFYLAVYLGMSLVMWPLGARLVRSEVLEALDAEYVQAIELVGAKRSWIIRHHIFPKVLPTLFLLFFYQLTDIVIGISLLGYLGFGSESTIVWGSDLAKSFLSIGQASDIQNEWWTVIFPSLFIFGIVLGLTLFSDALRDSYASRFRGGRTGTLHSSIGGQE